MIQAKSKTKHLCGSNALSIGYPDLSYALSYEMVIAQQDYICGIIGAPTTIIQFKKDEGGFWDRIDSNISGITLRTSCDTLRRCGFLGEKICMKSDDYHVNLFNGFNSKYKYKLKQKIDRASCLEISGIALPSLQEQKVKTYEERTYIEYRCPFLEPVPTVVEIGEEAARPRSI